MVAIDHTRGNQATLNWLLYDGHGNLVRTMSSSYALSENWQWRGVWGEVQGSLGMGRGYCANLGHPEDETGLVYMRARYYEPATGRFISEDPARDGVNWYLYADGDPVGKVDMEGKDSRLAWEIAGLIAGIATSDIFYYTFLTAFWTFMLAEFVIAGIVSAMIGSVAYVVMVPIIGVAAADAQLGLVLAGLAAVALILSGQVVKCYNKSVEAFAQLFSGTVAKRKVIGETVGLIVGIYSLYGVMSELMTFVDSR